MFSLFTNYNPDVYRSLSNVPEWFNIERVVSYNVKKVREYMRSIENAGLVENNILIDLIRLLCPDINLDDVDFYNIVSRDSLAAANKVGFCSELNSGKVHKNVIYKNSQEIFVTVKKEVYFRRIEERWRDYCPIRIIYTEDLDLNYECRLKTKDMKNSLVVYEVDVPRYLIMFKKWAEERRRHEKSTHPLVFLTEFVLPNMLLESINLIIFNRFMFFVKNGDKAEIKTNTRNLPFYYTDMCPLIDKALKRLATLFKERSMTLGRLLNSIPTIKLNPLYPREMLYYLRLTFSMFSIKTKWLPMCTRLRYLKDLTYLIGPKGINYNKDIYRALQRQLLRVRNRDIVLNPEITNGHNEEIINDLEYLRSLLFDTFKIRL